MRGHNVSRQAALVLSLGCTLIVAGCTGRHVSDMDRLGAQNAFEVATKQVNERQWAAALTTLQQANALDPGVPLYRNALGVVWLQVGRPDLALAEFRRATELDRDYAEAHLNLGIAHAEQRQWAEAVASYERAIKSPRLMSADVAYHNLGLALYHLARYAEAEYALRFALSLDPRMASAYYHLGLLMLAMDRKSDAASAFQRAREMAPDSPFGRAAVDRLRALQEAPEGVKNP